MKKICDEIDLAKIQNFVDSNWVAPMNIQEEKALCRAVIDIAKWLNDMYVILNWAREHDPEVGKTFEYWIKILETEKDAN